MKKVRPSNRKIEKTLPSLAENSGTLLYGKASQHIHLQTPKRVNKLICLLKGTVPPPHCLLWGLWRRQAGTASSPCWKPAGRSGPRRCPPGSRELLTGTWVSHPPSSWWWPAVGWRWRPAIPALRAGRHRAAPPTTRHPRRPAVCQTQNDILDVCSESWTFPAHQPFICFNLWHSWANSSHRNLFLNIVLPSPVFFHIVSILT